LRKIDKREAANLSNRQYNPYLYFCYRICAERHGYMEILVYGCGAVGLSMAATLYKAGYRPDVKANGATAEAIRNYGIKRVGIFGEAAIPPGAVRVLESLDAADSSACYDYILICTKTLSNAENALDLKANRHLLKHGGRIVILQNGLGTEEAYLRHFDAETICNARVITGFKRNGRNISEVTVHLAPILLGNLNGSQLDMLVPLAEAISKGGIECEVTDEVGRAIWAKVLYNCTLNPLGAILGLPYGKLLDYAGSFEIMNRLIEEIYAVMTAAGHETYWATADEYKRALFGKLIPNSYSHESSTLQDVRRKIPTEIDSLNGSIVRMGQRLGIPVPVNETLVNLIKAIESGY